MTRCGASRLIPVRNGHREAGQGQLVGVYIPCMCSYIRFSPPPPPFFFFRCFLYQRSYPRLLKKKTHNVNGVAM